MISLYCCWTNWKIYFLFPLDDGSVFNFRCHNLCNIYCIDWSSKNNIIRYVWHLTGRGIEIWKKDETKNGPWLKWNIVAEQNKVKMNKKSTDAYARIWNISNGWFESRKPCITITIHRTKQHVCNGLCAIMVRIEENVKSFNVNSSLIEYSSKYLRSTNTNN